MSLSSIPFVEPANLVAGLYPQNTGSFFSPDQTLTNGAAPGTANNPNINFQVTIEEHHHDEMDIVDHPIEVGAPITDHTFKRPAELILHLGWTANQLLELLEGDTPETSATQADYLNALAQVYAQLLQGQANRVLYTVNTTKRVYQNMAIKSISTTTDKETHNVLMVTLILRELILVTTQIVSVSASPIQQLQPQNTNPDLARSVQALTNASNYKAK
jgi:hypothetical protein